jgi:hypothetical protein
MGETAETILGLGLAALILGASWWVTDRFARAMYRRCAGCGTLNARRREACRECGRAFASE